MPELLLALDVGTTTVTSVLFTPEGRVEGRAAAAVRLSTPAPGRVEQDAGAIARAARRTLRGALRAAGRRGQDVAALGLTTQRTSLVLWDRATGRPLGPMIVWSDLRGAARAAELAGAGYPVAPQQAAAKLEQAIASVPEARDLMKAGRLAWGNIDSFLIWTLTGGVHVTDRSQAWPTGYLGLADLGWNAGLMDLQGLDPAIFPALADTWGVMGTLDPAVLGAPVPIAADVADQQASVIGHGAEAAGEGKATYGTSATVDVSTGEGFVFAGQTLPPFVLASAQGRTWFCVEGMVFAAGSAVDWARATLGLGGHARFNALAAQAPDACGAWFLPALQGLGAPHGDAARRGALGGLSLAVGKPEVARAVVEGVAFRVREVFEAIHAGARLPAPEVLRADGGLTGSEALMQAQADLLARPVSRHALREATAAGAAICAGRGVGLLKPGETSGFAAYDRTFEPRLSADEADARFTAWRSAAL